VKICFLVFFSSIPPLGYCVVVEAECNTECVGVSLGKSGEECLRD
jgi:hypothetical protein